MHGSRPKNTSGTPRPTLRNSPLVDPRARTDPDEADSRTDQSADDEPRGRRDKEAKQRPLVRRRREDQPRQQPGCQTENAPETSADGGKTPYTPDVTEQRKAPTQRG